MLKLIKWFLVFLILQFLLYNFVTFVIGYDSTVIWLWKEWLIFFFFVYFLYYIYKHKDYKRIIFDKKVFWLEIIFAVSVILAFIISYFKWISISQFIMAFKFDFFWFLIFFVFYNLWWIWWDDFTQKILKFFGRFIVIILSLAILWYLVILIKPWGLRFFWYDRNIHEWISWHRPPAAYLTRENYWYPRNQFLFERPISYGFFLIALWPLFYMLYIRKRSFKNTRGRRLLYWFNIFLTFSRAALWAWFLQIILLWIIKYKNDIKKYFLRLILPLIIVWWAIAYLGYDHLINREYSNTWHIKLAKEGFNMFAQSPIFGVWAWTAWPASHRVCQGDQSSWVCLQIAQINERTHTNLKWFNPENQYLQILIEFGIIIFGMWFLVYLFLNIYWFMIYFKSSKKQLRKDPRIWYILGFSIGMIWLSIEWFVLHSFVDRMIVYPMMILYWLSLGSFIFSPPQD